ncbi:death-associated protein kinase 1-like isoform X2 [Oscarella lobularis]|uniref:death-associated protein kinase 1-like isoform X2 n=1 Tax=Oscarella lobularis TaxID=121494 RepID=UPI003313B2FE
MASHKGKVSYEELPFLMDRRLASSQSTNDREDGTKNGDTSTGGTALHYACFHGQTELAKDLIDHYRARVNVKDKNGWTPLMVACQEGHLFMTQMLVSKNCSVKIQSKKGGAALHVASFHGQTAVTEYLIDHCGVNVNEQNNDGWTSLMMACQEGHLDTVQLLVSKQCDINIRNKDGWTALHAASCKGQTAVTEYLIDHCGVNADEQNNDGWTSLMMACQEGHLDTVQLLVSKQCDINIRKKNSGTALHVASFYGKSAVTEYLIDHCGVNVNDQDNDGWTSLMLACPKGHFYTVRLLVSKQCDINIRTKDGWTALHVASFSGQTAVTEYLIDHCGVNVNDQNNDGRTSLMFACQKGHLDTVQLLVSKQCDINIRDKNGLTALHVASFNGQTAVTKYLIDHCGVNVDDQDNDGWTSLMCACQEGHLKTVQLLVSKQCDINIRTKNGSKTLHVASSNGQTAVTEYLIDHCGVNVDEQTNGGWTSLMHACQKGHLDTVQLLVSKQCDINIRDKNSGTALHVASFNGQSAVAEYLIDHCGVNVDDQDNDGWTLLMYACKNGHLDTVQLLVSKQCNINIRTKDGSKALHVASSNGQTAVTEYLIDHCGVNVNEQNNDGWTSLMMACEEGHLDTVQLLVSKQCDINIGTKSGKTALFLSCSCGQNDIAEFLIKRKGLTFAQNSHDVLLAALRNCRFSSVQQLASCVLFDKMTVVNDVLLTRRNKKDNNFSEPQLLSLLLARGASASVKNKHGKLPYEYASGESRRVLKHAWLESQYAELSIMGCSSPSRIKVCVIGNERAGKSTLIRSLQQSLLGALARSIFGQDDPDRTAGIKFEEANIDSAGELVFCDFGGQKDFHKTHSLFFSSATVFVLVIDLSRPWNEILDSGFYWPSFTKCSLLVSADSKARLILVGSRGEQVGPELLKRLSRSLKTKFSKWFDVSDEQFVLDCRSPRTQTMDSIRAHLGQLKQQCMKSAKKVPSIVEKVESDLLPLVRKLLLSSEHPLQALAKAKNLLPEQLSSVIRQLLCNEDQCSEEGTTILSDFELTVDKIQRTDRHCIPCGLLLAMIDKTVFPGLRKDVQTQILKFLHTYSSIIVFEEEDVLVVNPNWLCYNVIGPLMSPKEFPIHMTPTTNGIFSLEDIRVTLKEFSKSQKTRLTDVNEAIKILCRLEICYPLPYNPHKFQFPALIQEERPADAWMNNADKPVYVGRRLQCDNDTDIITPGTMPFFQAHVAAGLGSPESVSSLSPIVWKGGIKTFESVRGLRFETLVELTENERAIDIIVRGPMYSAAECYKLVQETKTRVEEMLDQRSPGTDLFELVLSCKDMKKLAEPRHGYSCEEIDCAKSDDEYPKVSLDSTSEEYVSDLIAVPDDHVNVVLPCEVKRYMHDNFCSTSLVPQSMARSLGMRRTRLSSTSSADSVFIQWSQRMDATLPKLIKALKETEQTDLLDMLEEEGLVPIEVNLEVASASDDSENLAIEDNEGELNEGELSGACFMPREEVDMHYEDKSTVTKFDDDEIVKDCHIDAIENELFEDHDDVVSFGSKLLGWSHTKVLSYLSDRPDRRIGQKVSRLLYRWKDQVETPTISMLLSYLKKFDKEGIAIQLLKSCKKP